ncbi:MAG: tetratricopeptide repeat protein [Patescibacteria group bacterium]|nr:tetratricopeptide repeat protein [Patescibacteria group bacterium]
MTSAALDPLTSQAINAALNNDWPTAIALNEELLNKYPNDLEILNRLGRSYLGMGQLNKAKTAYRQVLEIDPYNPIALKNLKRLSELKARDLKRNLNTKLINKNSSLNGNSKNFLDPNIFLEEPGKTKVLALSDLAMTEILVTLHNGESVTLNPFRDEIIVTSENGARLGKIVEEWGVKIAKAIRIGSKFSAIIKSFHPKKSKSDVAQLTILVREIKRAKELEGKPFFPIVNNGFTPFVSEETISLLNIEHGEHGEEHEKHPEEESHLDREKYEQSTTSSNSLESLAEQEEKTLEEMEKEEL